MKNNIHEYYMAEKEQILNSCIACGKCIRVCPHMSEDDSVRLQKKVLEFIKNPFEDDEIYNRAFSCTGCFKCTYNSCPKGLNPMVINEIIKWNYHTLGFKVPSYTDPMDKCSNQRVLSSIQVSKEDYTLISNEKISEKADVVFFPGCNIYYQPDKLLGALDVLDQVDKNYSFLPGLEYCCGNIQMVNGDVDEGEKAYRSLINRLKELKPKKVVFWCSSCIVRMSKIIGKYEDFDFEILTMSQYLTQNKDKLNFKNEVKKNVVIHDPCKIVYADIDPVGPRELFKMIDGITVTPKCTNPTDELCCGLSIFVETDNIKSLRSRCLNEIASKNVDSLVDVCHTCHNLFLNSINEVNFDMDNYILILKEALGLENHKDLYKQIKKARSLNQIKEITSEFYEDSIYAGEIIDEAIKKYLHIS